MFSRNSADNQFMEIPFFPILFGVLKSPYVIGTVIFVVLYVAFASYVAGYKKKPPKPMKKKRVVSAPPPPPEPADESDETPAE